MNSRTLLLALVAIAPVASFAGIFGGVPPQMQKSQWRFSVGKSMDISGSVDETFNAYYTDIGRDTTGLDEHYDLEDFGIDSSSNIYGLHYNCQWKYFSFKWDTMIFNVEGTSHARRNYYIGLLNDEISYNGRKYDHMMIPEGQETDINFTGGIVDMIFGFTPMTFLFGDTVRLTPCLDFGLVVCGGKFEVDAGSVRGTTTYQRPPVDFLIGGKSDSIIGLGAPVIGFGAELSVGYDDDIRWVTKANIDIFSYSGSTKLFGGGSGNSSEKDLDVTFLSLIAETALLIPVTDHTDLSLGLRLQVMDADASIKSKPRDHAYTEGDIHERWDKDFDFRSVMLSTFIGLQF